MGMSGLAMAEIDFGNVGVLLVDGDASARQGVMKNNKAHSLEKKGRETAVSEKGNKPSTGFRAEHMATCSKSTVHVA